MILSEADSVGSGADDCWEGEVGESRATAESGRGWDGDTDSQQQETRREEGAEAIDEEDRRRMGRESRVVFNAPYGFTRDFWFVALS